MALKNRTIPTAGFPKLGTIFKGSPKTTYKDDQGKEKTKIGKDLDYFRFEPKNYNPELREVWLRHYGDEPKAINFMVLGDRPQDVFDPFYCQFATIKGSPQGRKVLECDGENIVREMNPTSQKFQTVEKPCRRLPDEDHCDKCKPSGLLKMIIPELWTEGFCGYVEIAIKGQYDLGTVQSNLQAMYQVLIGLGKTLHGVPLVLERGDRIVNTRFQKNGVWIPKIETKSLLSITLEKQFLMGLVALMRGQSAINLFPELTTVKLLPPKESLSATEILQVGESPKQRLYEICLALHIDKKDMSEYVKRTMAYRGIPETGLEVANLKKEDCDNTIVNLMEVWALDQNVWKDDNYCIDTFEDFMEANQEIEFKELAIAWYEKIQQKLSDQTIEVPALIPEVQTQDPSQYSGDF